MTENIEPLSRRRLIPFLSAAATLVFIFILSSAAQADQLDRLLKRGTLTWGADESGGGPYAFPKGSDDHQGFEVEIANELAAELTKKFNPRQPLKATLSQGDWDVIPDLVDKGDIDIALNGFELKPSTQVRYLCSRPYYVFGLQLVTRRDLKITSWDDLRNQNGSKLKIGVLGGSSAELYLRGTEKKKFADSWEGFLDISLFKGNIEVMDKMVDGEFDLTLLDDCAATFYMDRYPSLKFVGRPVSEGSYVILVKKGENRLHTAINDALETIINDGRLQKIYDRWSMNGKSQMILLQNTPAVSLAKQYTWRDVLANDFPLLLKAAGITVLLACASMPLAILIGISIAIGRLYGPHWLNILLAIYVEVIRGTPLILQLFVIYFLLPRIGIALEPFTAGIMGLAINYSAYEAEIYRAGFQAVPRGQMEAALSLGMTSRQAIIRVILPQAFRIVIPPVTNDFIALFKDTSVCSVITIVELTSRYTIQSRSTGAVVEIAILTSILYLLMSYPLSLLARYSERKLGGQLRIA